MSNVRVHRWPTKQREKDHPMRRAALLFILAASDLTAQPRPAKGPRPDSGSVYVSLMGEPFRARDGRDDPFDRWFTQADEDGDSSISRLEFRRDAEAFFQTLDVNDDAVIDADEISHYEKVVAPAFVRVISGPPPGNSGLSGPPKGTPPATGDSGMVPIVAEGMAPSASRIRSDGVPRMDFANVPQPVAMADLNLDRRVTPDEFAKTASRRFTNYDTDNDAQLTPKELRPSRGRGR